MAITTFDLAAAGARPPFRFAKSLSGTMVAGRPHSFWSMGGAPGAGSFDTTLNGVTLSSTSALVSGQIPHYDPASGNSNLLRMTARCTQPGVLTLLDRIWHNGGYTITSTSAQNSTTPTWPSRCPTSGIDDTPATTGIGVRLFLEVSAQTGSGTPTVTVTYTNTAGTNNRTATNIIATVANSIAGTTYEIGLQAGDVGVKSVESLQLSATWTSGTMNLVAARVLAEIAITDNGAEIDWLTGGAARIYDGAVPYLMFTPSTTTTSTVFGTYQETQG